MANVSVLTARYSVSYRSRLIPRGRGEPAASMTALRDRLS